VGIVSKKMIAFYKMDVILLQLGAKMCAHVCGDNGKVLINKWLQQKIL